MLLDLVRANIFPSFAEIRLIITPSNPFDAGGKPATGREGQSNAPGQHRVPELNLQLRFSGTLRRGGQSKLNPSCAAGCCTDGNQKP
jgi:hypothetical protein